MWEPHDQERRGPDGEGFRGRPSHRYLAAIKAHMLMRTELVRWAGFRQEMMTCTRALKASACFTPTPMDIGAFSLGKGLTSIDLPCVQACRTCHIKQHPCVLPLPFTFALAFLVMYARSAGREDIAQTSAGPSLPRAPLPRLRRRAGQTQVFPSRQDWAPAGQLQEEILCGHRGRRVSIARMTSAR